MKSWLQLFRAPNLFTVPGDPLAGFLLASAGVPVFRPGLAAVIAASLLFYCFGLVLNDLMDLPEDRVARPRRPLPSGAVKVKHAALVAILAALAAIGCCALAGTRTLFYGIFILIAVIAYNCFTKKIFLLGSVNMGLCRSFDVSLGAALASAHSQHAMHGAAAIGGYIAAVAILARNEIRNPAIPPLIGRMIRALILIQAVLCALAGGVAGRACAAVLALALWPLSRIVGKRFYGS